MNTVSKICTAGILAVSLLAQWYAAVDTVSCDSHSSYAANSCDQCFTGWSVSVGQNKGLLTDVWENTSGGSQVLFKEEQEMPQMISLGWASWTEVKASDNVDFWNYTPALDALYDEDSLWYKLDDGQTVTWIESSLWSAYQLSSNPVASGDAIGILAYDVAVHNIESDGNLTVEPIEHRECVLYTSDSDAAPAPTTPSQPEKLPETGAEHILLAFVALLLGFGFLKFRTRE